MVGLVDGSGQGQSPPASTLQTSREAAFISPASGSAGEQTPRLKIAEPSGVQVRARPPFASGFARQGVGRREQPDRSTQNRTAWECNSPHSDPWNVNRTSEPASLQLVLAPGSCSGASPRHSASLQEPPRRVHRDRPPITNRTDDCGPVAFRRGTFFSGHSSVSPRASPHEVKGSNPLPQVCPVVCPPNSCMRSPERSGQGPVRAPKHFEDALLWYVTHPRCTSVGGPFFGQWLSGNSRPSHR